MRPRPDDRLAILVAGPVRAFELAIAVEVFDLDRPEVESFYDTTICAVAPGRLASTSGLDVHVERGLDALDDVGTIVVPGWTELEGPGDPRVHAALQACLDRGGRVVGICSGTYALAQAGVLDGRRATTHWRFTDDLAARFPRIDVDPDVLYVEDGPVLTSAGSAAGIDAALHLVREDWGPATAAAIARGMVVPPIRDGSQAQHVSRPVVVADAHDVGTVQRWVLDHLDQPIGIAEMAAVAATSERTFVRRFRAATGTSPGAWVVRQRLSRAQELLATTDRSIEQIARDVGFGSAVSLRHHVRGILRTTPTAYRRRFRDAA